MPILDASFIVSAITEQFDEAYQGPSDEYSWFTNNEEDAGILGTLAHLSAREASKTITKGGTTVAAHAEHLRWSLALANGVFRGETPEPHWSESWTVKQVDTDEWTRLRDNLQREYKTLCQTLGTNPNWVLDEDFFSATLALVPHAAYHLGAIRQMLSVIKQ